MAALTSKSGRRCSEQCSEWYSQVAVLTGSRHVDMLVDLTVEDSVYCRVTSQHAQSNQQLGGGYLFQTIEAGYGVGQRH